MNETYFGFCIRIQSMEGYGAKIRMLGLNDDYEQIAGIQHKGDKGENTHYHLVIKTRVKEQAMRVRFRKIFDLGKGNAHMSIKEWDGDIRAISYLFHEDPNQELFYRHNIDDETVEKARAKNIEVQDKVAQAKEKASWKIEEELMTIYREKHLKPNRYTIAGDIMLYALRHDKYVPNDFLLKSMAAKIEFKLLDSEETDEINFALNYISTVYRLDEDQHRMWVDNPSRRGGAFLR